MDTTEHHTVEAFLDRLRQAWDAGDAQAYAELFAPDASYVIFLGDALSGRAEIARTHHDVFTRWQQGTRMAVRAIDIRMVGPDTAVAVTVGGIGTGDTIPFDKFQTYVLRSRDGRWECVAFQNTEMSDRAQRAYAS